MQGGEQMTSDCKAAIERMDKAVKQGRCLLLMNTEFKPYTGWNPLYCCYFGYLPDGREFQADNQSGKSGWLRVIAVSETRAPCDEGSVPVWRRLGEAEHFLVPSPSNEK